MRFRPDDGYSKPTCGDRHSKTAFLLRVRVKKNRINEVQKNVQRSEANTNVESIKNDFRNVSLNDDNQKNKGNQSDVQNHGDLKKDNVVIDLVEKIQNCNVSTNTESSSKVSSSEIIKTIADTSVDTGKNLVKGKKNIAPTFDRNKYEDLSQDEQYELPKLKILGRIDTEFQFTSMYFNNIIKIYRTAFLFI